MLIYLIIDGIELESDREGSLSQRVRKSLCQKDTEMYQWE